MQEHMGEKVHKISKIDELNTQKPVEEITRTQEVNELPERTKFDAAISKAELNFHLDQAAKQAQKLQPVSEIEKKGSPIDEISLARQKIEPLPPATLEQLNTQAKDLRSKFHTTIDQLKTVTDKVPDAKISPVYEAQLSQRLGHIDANLKTVTEKAGIEATAGQAAPAAGGPLVKFLGYLTSSDRQLQTLLLQMQGLDAGKKLTPEKMLSIQVKLSFVQQELEFFANVLNKALEGVKTTMNVQI